MLIKGRPTVPPRTVLALVLGAAVSVVVALLIINSVFSRGSGPQLTEQGRIASVPSTHKGSADPRLPPAALEKLVGQRFMVGLRGIVVQGALLEDARKGMIGGVVLFPEGAGEAEVARAAAELQAAARRGGNPPLLIATDQEGGPVKRFPQGPPLRRLSGMNPTQALAEGRRTGAYLRELRINTNLAPVVDLGLPNSFIARQGRTISADPHKVGEIGGAFATGQQQTLTLAVAKHFPGLGHASVNTDLQRTEVTAGVSRSLIPFRELIRTGVKGVMVSTAAYRTLDPAHGAAWSRKIVTGLLRRKLGFDGLVFSDDLSSMGVHEWMSTPAAAEAAAEAGVDVLLIGEPDSFRPAFRAVVRAAKEAGLKRQELEHSYRRIVAAKEWVR